MLTPISGPQPAAVVPSCLELSLNTQRVLFEDLSAETQSAVLNYVFDDQTKVEWSEEDVVFLHWKMLHRLVDLCEPATPLEEKIDMLRWVFTDPSLDEQPFSFASCVRVAALSPHSPIPYCGVMDPNDVRDWLRQRAPVWLGATMNRFPHWVRTAIVDNPQSHQFVMAGCGLAWMFRVMHRPEAADVDSVWPLAQVRAERDGRPGD